MKFSKIYFHNKVIYRIKKLLYSSFTHFVQAKPQMLSNQCRDAELVSSYIKKFLLKKSQQQIKQKTLVSKTLTPFLGHQVVKKGLIQNFRSIVVDYDSKATVPIKVEQPQKKTQENMKPKNLKILSSRSLKQKNATVSLKKSRSFKKRPFSSIQTSKFINMKDEYVVKLKAQTQNEESVKNSRDQRDPKNYFVKKSELFHKKSELSHKKNQFVKLKQEQKRRQDSEDSFEQQLRSKMLTREQQRKKTQEIETLKLSRIEKLKQKVKIQQQQGEMCIFDYDGSLINLKHDEQPAPKKNIPKAHTSKIIKNLTAKKKISDTRLLAKEKNKNLNQNTNEKLIQKQQNPLVIETLYSIKENSSKQLSEIESIDFQSFGSHCLKSKQELKSCQIYIDSSQKGSKQSLNIHPITLKHSLVRNSIRSRQHTMNSIRSFNENKSIKTYNFFLDSSAQKNLQNKEIQKQIHKENQRQFNNNFQRQTSTVPFLQLHEGIRYQEEISVNPLKKTTEQSDVRFVTIEKHSNSAGKEIKPKIQNSQSSVTFQSYLPYSDTFRNTKNSFNQTISVFSSTGRSFCIDFTKQHHCEQQPQSARMQFEFSKKVQKMDSKSLGKSRQLNNLYLKTPKSRTKNSNQNSNKIQFPSRNEEDPMKTIMNPNILDLKEKLMQRQRQKLTPSRMRQIS